MPPLNDDALGVVLACNCCWWHDEDKELKEDVLVISMIYKKEKQIINNCYYYYNISWCMYSILVQDGQCDYNLLQKIILQR